MAGFAQAADLPAAQALYNSGQYSEAALAASKAIEAGEYDDAWPLLKIRSEMVVGAYAEALAALDAAQSQHATSLALRLAGRDVYLFNNQPVPANGQLTIIQTLVENAPWRYSDAANRVLLGRTLLLTGAEPRQILELLYDKARKERPDELDAYQASAELALEKHDDALAAQSLAKAIKLAPRDPELHYLLAKALLSADEQQATASLATALRLNPRHVPSLLLQVDQCLDDEDDGGAEKLLEQVFQINPRQPEAWAYRAVLAHLAGDKKSEQSHRAKALEPWPGNPHVDHLIGLRLARKYRFAEAAAYERRALELDPTFVSAKIQLSQDLLRLGEEDEGWRLANEAFNEDGYNVVAHNLTTLHETLARFKTLEDSEFIVRMGAREAEIYGARVLELLHRARAALASKYKVELREPVIVEIFPEQKDFAARTFGLPGGIGFLGVCFGRVITANSPASQGDHPANWESVLWHEFCHVVTLHKTHNKMPRWLSEGISVYEERQADPAWGQSMDPKFRAMVLGDDLTPVSQLSGAFLKARKSDQLQFAYFESSLVVQYLVERYGLKSLERILTDLADDVPINQALARHTVSIEELDRDFAAYAKAQASALAPQADWSKLDVAEDADLAAIEAWNKEHPHHFEGLQRLAREFIAKQQWKAAVPVVAELATIDPAGALPLLALAHRKLDQTAAERAALEKLIAVQSDATDAYLRLIEIAAAAKDWPAVEQNAQRALAVNPLVAAPYRHLVEAAEALAHWDLATQAQQVLLVLDPSDPAEAHYRLARLLYRQKHLGPARRHVLQALEETPRFRAAQRLLLDLVDAKPATEQPAAPDATAEEKTP
jgi:tetratricopeptide (TPR) repeat protein